MTHFHHSNMSHQDYYGSQFVMLGNPKKCFLAQNGMYAIIYNLSRICQNVRITHHHHVISAYPRDPMITPVPKLLPPSGHNLTRSAVKMPVYVFKIMTRLILVFILFFQRIHPLVGNESRSL